VRAKASNKSYFSNRRTPPSPKGPPRGDTSRGHTAPNGQPCRDQALPTEIIIERYRSLSSSLIYRPLVARGIIFKRRSNRCTPPQILRWFAAGQRATANGPPAHQPAAAWRPPCGLLSKLGTMCQAHLCPHAASRPCVVGLISRVGVPIAFRSGPFQAATNWEHAMDDPFRRVRDPLVRADRYRKMAAEYSDLARTASSPFLRSYYRRIAEQYFSQADGQSRVAERQDDAAAKQSGSSTVERTGT